MLQSRPVRIAMVTVGIVVVMPIIYMVRSGYTDKIGSAVVLAITALAVAVMAGALWNVAHVARSAFALWKNDRSDTGTFPMKEARQ